jgi:heparin/heparan-sulfate lyase
VGGEFNVRKWSIHPFLLTELEKAPPASKPEGLPTARHFGKMGQIFMRSGDGPHDTYALFACGGTLRQHRHYDATHFTIYRKGYLALDSGTRQGNTDNLQNYYAQTVAHNCLLIKMPGEPPSPYWNGEVFGQAGGQNSTIGSVLLAFETGEDFTYVAGDATPVYSADKCRFIARQLVFLPPHHFVVFDRVAATQSGYAKTWLMHHANEPSIDGNTWRSDQDRGRIFCRTLLPEDVVLEKVGGPGKEFLADGVNYPIDAGPSQFIIDKKYHIYKMEYDEVPELMGRWRMEVKPGEAREEDLFLHVLQVGDQSLTSMVDTELSVDDAAVIVAFDTGPKQVEVRLATEGDVGGHIRIGSGGNTLVDRPLATDVMPQTGLANG